MYRCVRCKSEIISQKINDGEVVGIKFNENLEIIKYDKINHKMGVYYCEKCGLSSYNVENILELKVHNDN